ncbi:MAG: hypothetical protein KKA70_10690 [Proteobacteria bacterium]|nr:hypothetical protein [Pseudomonadota bacterium]
MAEKQIVTENLTVTINGKLAEASRFDGTNGPIFENLIVIPSKDQYTSPTRIIVKAGHQLAQLNSMVEVKASIRSRYWKNNKSGKVQYTPELWLSE